MTQTAVLLPVPFTLKVSSLSALQPKFEAVLSEIEIVLNELYHSISNLARWMQPEYVSKSLVGSVLDAPCDPRTPQTTDCK